MQFSKSKSSSEKRVRPDYNGAVTALTEAEWAELAAARHGRDWVVIIDGKVRYESEYWLNALGAFFLNTHAGQRVIMASKADHDDYQRRVAEAALVAL